MSMLATLQKESMLNIIVLFLTISFHFRTSFEALAKDKKLFHFRFLEQFNFIMTILLSKII